MKIVLTSVIFLFAAVGCESGTALPKHNKMNVCAKYPDSCKKRIAPLSSVEESQIKEAESKEEAAKAIYDKAVKDTGFLKDRIIKAHNFDPPAELLKNCDGGSVEIINGVLLYTPYENNYYCDLPR